MSGAHRMIHPSSSADAEVERPLDVVELFRRQALLTPHRLALSTGEAQLTYEELDRRTQLLHARLESLNVAPQTPVGVLAERTPDALVAALAVLRAGCVYVPIDPAYPPDRIRYMLQDSGAQLVLGASARRGSLEPSTHFLALDEAPDVAPGALSNDSREPFHPKSLAYVIYTSGSTGAPKGVMVEHGGLLNLILDHMGAFEVVPEDRILLVTSPSFDASMFQLFIAWGTGATVLLPPERVIADPDSLVEWINTHRATLLSMPPAYLHALGRRPMPSVRLVNTGGDAPIVEDALHYARTCRYFSTYGPTETTICSAYHEVRADEEFPDGIPLGLPVRNASLFIVDEAGELCPPGQVGEIWIAGAGVSRGYHARPELTAQKFVPHPLRPGERAYRTGDLGYQRPDGPFVFRGRVDRQVKVRGFRVEPEEVELRLQSLEGVERAVVLPVGKNASTRRLVAYVVGRAGLEPVALRNMLARETPAYMLPSRILVLDEFPRTANAKIDLAQLRELASRRQSSGEQALPPEEEQLVTLLEEILGVPVGADQGFFELGGDSLSAARFIVEARARLRYELPVRALLQGASIRELARALASSPQTSVPEVARLPDSPWYPASDAQRRLWLIHEVNGGSTAYNVCHAWWIDGELNGALLRQALEQLAQRHEALRTRFDLKDGVVVQRIEPEGRIDWHEEAGDRELEDFLERESSHAFSLREGPLVRAALRAVEPRRWLFTLNIHHIVCDGWSVGVIARELEHTYGRLRSGSLLPVEPLPLQLRDFTAWQRQRVEGPEGRAAADFWRSHLGEGNGPTPLELPTDRPRPPRPSLAGRVHGFRIPPEQLRALEQLAQRSRTTLFVALTSLVNVLLYRETRQRDISLGAPLAERDHVDLQEQIGFYVNTIVLRTQLDGREGFVQLLERVRQVSTAAQHHGFFPFDRIVEELALPRDPSRSPLFDVMVALQQEEHRTLSLAGTTCTRVDIPQRTSKFDLSFDFIRTGAELLVEIEYATDLFDARRIEQLAQRQLQLLDEVLHKPDAPLDTLQLLSPAELAVIQEKFRGRRFPPPPADSLLSGFHRVVAEDGERPAVLRGSRRLTYAQLAGWSRRVAEQLGQRLTKRGWPDGPTAVMLERSEAFFAAVLGILELGQTYLPLDPGLPPDRIRLLLRDSACAVLVTRASLLEGVSLDGVDIIDLDALDEVPPTGLPLELPARGANPLAYCIYTSGSTGQPKSVGVTRANLRNAVEMWRHDYGLERPVVLQLASFSFDVSVGDLGRSLLVGGTLVVATDEERVSPAAILSLVERHHVSFFETTPLVANSIRGHLETTGRQMPPLALMVVGSDICRMGDLRALRKRLHSSTRLVNSYGTTETTIDSSFFELDEKASASNASDEDTAPIGRPMSNVEFLVIDPAGQQLGIGTPGELCIAGPSVSAGYLGRPDLTAERFVPHPFRPGERMYRTGDLGALRGDGNIVLFGRVDHQIKIRGYRVELGEIASALIQHSSVRDAVALVLGSGAQASLMGCVVGPAEEELAELEAWLAARLPHFMVPTQWLILEALPASANGKVDRSALLAAASRARRAHQAQVEPSTPLERTLLEGWREVLPQARDMGITDSFFSLGGDSIQAIQLVLALRRRGVQLNAAELFRHPTIESCATYLESRQSRPSQELDLAAADVDEATRRRLLRPGDVEIYPATAVQSMMLEASARHRPVDAVYLGYTVWEFEDSRLDLPTLREALLRQHIRHNSLRTAFTRDGDGRWYQRVQPVDSVEIAELDLSDQARAAQDESIAAIGQRTMEHRGLLEGNRPACRISLVRRGPEACALIIATHHAVDDGWGLMALEKALLSDYRALRQGTVLPTPSPLPTGRQLIALEAERLSDEHAREYWAAAVRRLPPSPYTVREQRDSIRSRFSGFSLEVPSATGLAVEKLAQDEGLTLKALYLSALLRALAEDAHTRTSSAWVVMNGRSERLEAALEAVGLFWNLVPILGGTTGTPKAHAQELDARLREAEQHGAWFFPALFGDCLASGFPVCFNFTHFRNEEPPLEGIRVVARHMHNVWHFPLTVSLSIHPATGTATLHAMHDTWTLPQERAVAILERMIHGLASQEATR